MLHVIFAIKYILSTMVGVEKEKSEPKRNETKTFVEKWRISPTSLTLALRIFHTLDEEKTGLKEFLINLG